MSSQTQTSPTQDSSFSSWKTKTVNNYKIPKTEEEIKREKELLENGVIHLIDGFGRFSFVNPLFSFP